MMFRLTSLLVALVLWPASLAAQTLLGTGFTYQGELRDRGALTSGTYDFRFRLFAAPAGGSPIASVLCAEDTPVTDGRFKVELDFGPVFTGERRYLEIQVRAADIGDCSSAAGFLVLSPRQELTITPNAGRALAAGTADNASNFAGLPPSAFATLQGNNVFTQTNVFSGPFTGVGCSEPLTGSDPFGVSANEPPGAFIGMYVRANNVTSKPFYGYDAGRTLRWWTYLNGTDNSWRLSSNGLDVLVINAAGSLGLGIAAPLDRLDVRGNIRFGAAGDQLAVGAPAPTRVLGGRLFSNGTIAYGTGFTASRISTGYYRVTFSTPFTVAPAVTATGIGGPRIVFIQGVTTSVVDIVTQTTAGAALDSDVSFTVIGPR